MKEHNHVRKLRRLIAKGHLPETLQPGSVSRITIAHDPWCRLLRKGQRCNCDPDIHVAWTLPAGAQH